MGLLSWLQEMTDRLSEHDRSLKPRVEEVEAELAQGNYAAALRHLSELEPESDELRGRILALRLRAALEIKDLIALEALAGQVEPLGRLQPERARLYMFDAEAAGALELARSLAEGLSERDEDVAEVLSRLEGRKTAHRRAEKLVQIASEALGDDHEDVRLIGTGRMSFVVSCYSRSRQERVACKFLNPNIDVTDVTRQRFEREATALLCLGHPNILKIHSYELNPPMYLLTEFFPGVNLTSLIEQGRRFEPREVAKFAFDLTEAVAHAHSSGVIHRDIQAGNVLMDKEGHVKLVDFGMARLGESSGVTVSGSALGDWKHHPPEVFMGTAEGPTQQMDVFGIGVTLYEMVTGQPPYVKVRGFMRERGPDIGEVVPHFPEDLLEAIRVALAEDPAERWENVSKLRGRLLTCLA